MGQQTGFFATDQDHALLLDRLHELECRAIPPIIDTDSQVEAVSVLDFDVSRWDYFYVLPPDMAASEAFYVETTNDPAESILMPDRSAVVQFQPSPRVGSAVEPGRVYIALPSDDSLYPPVRKTYDRIARLIRKWTRAVETRLYVGPHAAALSRAGEIELKHFDNTFHPQEP